MQAELLHETTTALPGFSAAALHPIEKGGSSRRFFRVLSVAGDSVILVHDLGEKEENRHYASLASFLGEQGVPVPRVLAETHSGELRLLWLEDLGEQDLWATRHESWKVRQQLYESALRGLFLLHRIPPESAAQRSLHLQPGFDERLYRWEQEYFATHCLGGIFGISESQRDALIGSHTMQRLARQLASEPRGLVHRDFQSQNIMIRDGRARFIDFQGLRPGLPHYDLASLLCDPYVEMAAEERLDLLTFYRRLREEEGCPLGDNHERIFWQCAAQRLMQALGAYGFLSIHRGKPAFRAHIKPALGRLREALEQLPSEDRLDELNATITTLDLTEV